MSDADAISCLNRTNVLVIGDESIRTQLSERLDLHTTPMATRRCVKFFSKLNNLFSGYFDPENILLDNKNN